MVQEKGVLHGFLSSWVLRVAAGEVLGFLAPALVQPLTPGMEPGQAMLLFIAAGAVEGAVLGWAQFLVLRRWLPGLSPAQWIAGTSVAAAAAWFIGMSVGTFGFLWQQWAVPVQAIVGAMAALVLLGSIGFAQWLELRGHLARSGWWIAGSGAAWLVGLGVFLAVSTPLWRPGQPAALIVLIGILAAVAMALGMAVVTGLVMLRLLRSRT